MKRILVVDDDFDIGELISEYLTTNENYHVDYSSNGEEALTKMAKFSFDLIITDLLMPQMNGLELIQKILKENPHIKVMACSGGGTSGKFVAGIALDQALAEGAANGLVKPFTKEELLAKVENLIGS